MLEILNDMISFEKEINLFTVALRIFLAVILGGIIGIERGRHGSHAGMRTHILVCLGGAMTALAGVYSTQILGFDGDPFRIAAQVVSGIGFLGAGMIVVKSDKTISGLTTAAIMWTTAIIGISVGIGFYSGALIAMLACVFTAAVLTRIESKRRNVIKFYIELNLPPAIDDVIKKAKALLPADTSMELIPAKSATQGNIGLLIVTPAINNVEEVKNQLKALDGIHFIVVE